MPAIIQPRRNLVNGTRINGVEHIYQTAKPTTRVDGSALVARDLWYKNDDGSEWFWNGTYWLSRPAYFVKINSSFPGTNSPNADSVYQGTNGYFFTTFFSIFRLTTTATHDNSNKITCSMCLTAMVGGTSTNIYSIDSFVEFPFTGINTFNKTISINSYLASPYTTGLTGNGLGSAIRFLQTSTVGSPPTMAIYGNLMYHLVA